MGLAETTQSRYILQVSGKWGVGLCSNHTQTSKNSSFQYDYIYIYIYIYI